MANIASPPEEHVDSEALVDVFSYVKRYSPHFTNAQAFVHLKGLKKTVRAYWDHLPRLQVFMETGDPWDNIHCQLMFRKAPWLDGFRTIDGDLDAVLQRLAVTMATCTYEIMQLNTTLTNAIVLAEWKFRAVERLEALDEQRDIIRLDGPNVTYVTNMMGGGIIERSEHVTRGLWNDLQDCAQKLLRNERYRTFSMKVADFCLRAGCPRPRSSPLDSLYSLREHLSRGSGVEIELRKEIDELRKTVRKQQRIITNLSFRHLLEMLPPSGSSSSSSTTRWKTFFTTAVKQAQALQTQVSVSHPLVPLLQKYPKAKQVEDVGCNLYGTLSTNIHHYAGEYVVLDDQWDALQMDVMTALTPLTQNQSNAGVDWDRERQRY